MNLYELNKQAMAQMPALTNEEIDKKKKLLKNYQMHNVNQYFMLLCKDISYYTLFAINNEEHIPDRFQDVVIECAQNVGTLVSIEEEKDAGSIEIWVKPKDGEPLVMYLFGYDRGVITCQ